MSASSCCEAAEAYVLSQKQNGWHALIQRYEDGGFSGASLERPALQMHYCRRRPKA
jgi:hypothetical protein